MYKDSALNAFSFHNLFPDSQIILKQKLFTGLIEKPQTEYMKNNIS